jgi:hypothetical protein
MINAEWVAVGVFYFALLWWLLFEHPIGTTGRAVRRRIATPRPHLLAPLRIHSAVRRARGS